VNLRFAPDPLPSRTYETPRELVTLGEHLKYLYERMKQSSFPGYRLSDSYLKRFVKLASWLQKHSICPEDFMVYVFAKYSNPYPNIVCSKKAVAAFVSERGTTDENWEESLKWELEMFDYQKNVSSAAAALQQLQLQLSPITLFFLAKKYGVQLPEAVENKARHDWLFQSEQRRQVYAKMFPDCVGLLSDSN